eukprot:4076263-Pyramimonas_sp.AAC.1
MPGLPCYHPVGLRERPRIGAPGPLPVGVPQHTPGMWRLRIVAVCPKVGVAGPVGVLQRSRMSVSGVLVIG